MYEIISLGDTNINVVRKPIKNIYLTVQPPNGEIRISAPPEITSEKIRLFALSKLSWIKKQQQKIQTQEREITKEYINRESHYLWGERYLLKVIEENHPPQIFLEHKTLLLQVRPGTTLDKKEAIIYQWYRKQIKQAIPPLIAKWETLMNVKVNQFFVQRMKTKWGSCNPKARNIRLNSELAKKPRECLEYVVVHEMTHLLEPSHNQRFMSLMNSFIPQWRHHQQLLNSLPINYNN
ncbi:M48 family metallopeptidase [Cyanothece sp. BG0011]|uniref:M48 family metallopeptidase n=1 Tax=Cyanothece sp. BG0011 TaxID=2082950 RepID=UPI000D1EBB24|nr:SprT family zinc-dependent metalloprotease [Cyanothece sp. BG0011]